jgi:myo-inositol 2-dehydrogenase/D-chiro-inositol 1-dehydrogenase
LTKDNPIRVGVIGVGRIGSIHAGNLAHCLRGVTVAAIADVNLNAAQETAAALNVPKAVADYQLLLQDPTLDAVAICSSSDTHARLIIEAAEAGKHIFCEKPIDADLGRIDQALEAVRRARVKLQVGFNRRFDPNFHKVRERVAAGQIGQPQLLRITSRDPAPPPISYIQVSGGIFMDMTIHDFDMARYLVGAEAEEIYATGSVLVDSRIGEAGDLDTAVITLRFQNGAIGTIDNSRQAVYGYDQRVEVFGSKGMLSVANCTPDNLVLSDGEAVQSSKPLYFFLERYAESFLAEMQAFIESIRADTPPPVTGIDGRMTTLMGMAAWKSYRERRPVRLDEVDIHHT